MAMKRFEVSAWNLSPVGTYHKEAGDIVEVVRFEDVAALVDAANDRRLGENVRLREAISTMLPVGLSRTDIILAAVRSNVEAAAREFQRGFYLSPHGGDVHANAVAKVRAILRAAKEPV